MSGFMRDSDAFAWYMENDPTLRSTVVAVVWFERAPDWDVLVAKLERATRMIPNFRERVVEPPLRLADTAMDGRRDVRPGPAPPSGRCVGHTHQRGSNPTDIVMTIAQCGSHRGLRPFAPVVGFHADRAPRAVSGPRSS